MYCLNVIRKETEPFKRRGSRWFVAHGTVTYYHVSCSTPSAPTVLDYPGTALAHPRLNTVRGHSGGTPR